MITSQLKEVKLDDGKNDIVFGFEIEGEDIKACTVHEEFLDIAGVPVDKRAEIAQAIGQLFLGIMKPFMELVENDSTD